MDSCPSSVGRFEYPCDCLSAAKDTTTISCPAFGQPLPGRSASLGAVLGSTFPTSHADTTAHDCICEYDGRKCWERSYP